MRVARVDPDFFKQFPNIKLAMKEVRNMYETLDFTEIDDVLAGSRQRGKYDGLVSKFNDDLQEALETAADLPKFGIKVDLEGKSVAAVRAGLTKAVEKSGVDIKVVAPKGEAVYLIWLNQ